jgi:hypothetical protein
VKFDKKIGVFIRDLSRVVDLASQISHMEVVGPHPRQAATA